MLSGLLLLAMTTTPNYEFVSNSAVIQKDNEVIEKVEENKEVIEIKGLDNVKELKIVSPADKIEEIKIIDTSKNNSVIEIKNDEIRDFNKLNPLSTINESKTIDKTIEINTVQIKKSDDVKKIDTVKDSGVVEFKKVNDVIEINKVTPVNKANELKTIDAVKDKDVIELKKTDDVIEINKFTPVNKANEVKTINTIKDKDVIELKKTDDVIEINKVTPINMIKEVKTIDTVKDNGVVELKKVDDVIEINKVNPINPINTINTTDSTKDIFTEKFFLPDKKGNIKFVNYSAVNEFYKPYAIETVKDFKARYSNDGQFLKWVNLPENQLQKDKKGVSHLDKVYEQANILSKTNRPLVVLGIGGSKHTAEFLLNMTGFDRKNQVYFYSDIDPISYENFLEQINKRPEELNYLVVSKSGTTFETADGFARFYNAIADSYVKKGLINKEAEKIAQTHFAICTDKTATEKNLRGKIGAVNGVVNNYLKELYIHDDVGGRYSMFDDAGLFVLAYAGVPQKTTERILNGAIEATKTSLDTVNFDKNYALQSAIFNVFSRNNGYNIIQQQYFGKLFENAGENWAKQLYLESLKDFDFMIGKAPDSMHYATEGHFSPQNRDKYNTVMTIMGPDISENYNRYTAAIQKTYQETTPVKVEILPVENNAIKPEAIGEYVQTKHFETIYMGILRRIMAKNSEQYKVLPEVLQPSVETYKNKFKQGSEFELNPGR